MNNIEIEQSLLEYIKNEKKVIEKYATLLPTDYVQVDEVAVYLQVSANQTDAPVVTETTYVLGNGLSMRYDNTFTPVLWEGNLVTQQEAKYIIRFQVTGDNLYQNCSLCFSRGIATDPTGAALPAHLSTSCIIAGVAYPFAPMIDLTDLSTDPVYFYGLISNTNQTSTFQVWKIKQVSQVLQGETPSLAFETFGYYKDSPTPAYLKGSAIAGTGGTHITGITSAPIFVRTETANTGAVSGINKLVCTDIYSENDNLGYKNGSSAIHNNDRPDSGIIFNDVCGVFYIIKDGYVDGSVSCAQFRSSEGKKINATITGAGNKTLSLFDSGVLTRPITSSQMILKNTALIPANTSHILSSNGEYLGAGPDTYNIKINTSVADASTVVNGYHVVTLIGPDKAALDRLTVISKTGKPKTATFRIEYTQPTGAIVDDSILTITQVYPTDVADVPFKLGAHINQGFLISDGATNSMIPTTDFSASAKKVKVVAIPITWDAGWQLDGKNRLICRGIQRTNLATQGVQIGTNNAPSLPFPLIADTATFAFSITNLTQDTYITIQALNMGIHVNPDDANLMLPSINSALGVTANLAPQLYGWVTTGTGGEVVGVTTYSSMNEASLDYNVAINSTTGDILSGSQILAPVVPFLAKSLTQKIDLFNGEEIIILHKVSERKISAKPSHKLPDMIVTERMYAKKDVKESIESLNNAIDSIDMEIINVKSQMKAREDFIVSLKSSIDSSTVEREEFLAAVRAIDDEKQTLALLCNNNKKLEDHIVDIKEQILCLESLFTKIGSSDKCVVISEMTPDCRAFIKRQKNTEAMLRHKETPAVRDKWLAALGKTKIRNLQRSIAIERDTYFGMYKRHEHDALFVNKGILKAKTSPRVEEYEALLQEVHNMVASEEVQGYDMTFNISETIDASAIKDLGESCTFGDLISRLLSMVSMLMHIGDQIEALNNIKKITSREEGFESLIAVVYNKFTLSLSCEAIRQLLVYLAAKIYTDSFGYKVVEFGSKEIKDLEENSDKSKHNIHIKDDYHIYNLQSYIVADKLIANHANDSIVKRLISTYNNTRTSGAHLLMRCIFDDAVSMYNLYMSKKMNNESINDEQLIASVVDMAQIGQNGIIFRILKAIGITVTKEHIRELYERVLEFVKNHGSELYRIDHTGKIVMCSHSDPFKDKDFFHYIRDDIFMPIFIQASDVFSGLCRISDIARSLKEMRHNL